MVSLETRVVFVQWSGYPCCNHMPISMGMQAKATEKATRSLTTEVKKITKKNARAEKD